MRTKTTFKYLVIILVQCSISATLFSQQELIRNGDFSSGNTGFTSQYFYCNTKSCLYPTGGYAIGSNPDFFNPAFVGRDHTTGAGNFMIINGAESRYRAWKETVQVNPNTDYKFSVWISSMVTSFRAKLNFFINGVSIGQKNAPSFQNQWERFSVIWNSGSFTSATIIIVDLNTTAAENDFGLDDISFKTYSSIQAPEAVSSSESSLTELPDSPSKLSVYPNPSSGTITVKYNADRAGKAELIIYDIWGRTIVSKTNQTIKGTNTYYLNLSDLKPGYIVFKLATLISKSK
jgi:hypothetical protein